MDKNNLLHLLSLAKTPEQRAILLDALTSKDRVQAVARFKVEEILFDKQLEVLKDPAKRKVIVTSRRGGKSFLLAAYMLYMAMNYKRNEKQKACEILYIGLTKSAARDIIWDVLVMLIEDYQLPCKPNHHLLEVRFQNGAKISIEGAKDRKAMEQLRGRAVVLAILDEAQGFSAAFGETLVAEIIDPSLGDYNGTFVLAGTPDPLCQSILFRAYSREKPFKEYKPFHWCVIDNTKFPRFLSGTSTPENYLQEIMATTGYKVTDPGFRREYLGEFVEDKASLVYGFDPSRDLAKELPAGEWYYIISADLGFVDADAAIVMAFSYACKTAYVIESFSADKQDFTTMAYKIQELHDKYSPVMTLIDPGGGGKKMVEELNSRYSLISKAADKYNPKAGGCALVAADFRKEHLKIVDNESNELLILQLSTIVYHTKILADGTIKRYVPDGKQVKKGDQLIGDDLCDCLLYGFKYCRNYLAEEDVEKASEEEERDWIDNHKKQLGLRAAARQFQESEKPWF